MLNRNGKNIYAGTNEFYKFGHKTIEKLQACLNPNENGFYSVPAYCKDWCFGTSNGKYGEYARYGETFFSVNKAGNLWAKEGTDKAEAFVEMIKGMIAEMNKENEARAAYIESLSDDDDEI